MKTKNNKKSGFTLVELLLVILVVAVMAGGAIAGFGKYIEYAAESNMKQDAKMLSTAAKVHMQMNNLTTVPSADLIGAGNYVEALSDGVSCSDDITATFTLTHAKVNSGAAVTYVTSSGRKQ
jgi:prepilin-type N-terminal cleavage/methylation domain-containing protein